MERYTKGVGYEIKGTPSCWRRRRAVEEGLREIKGWAGNVDEGGKEKEGLTYLADGGQGCTRDTT